MGELECGLIFSQPDGDSSLRWIERRPDDLPDHEYIAVTQVIGAHMLSEFIAGTTVRLVKHQAIIEDADPTVPELTGGQLT